MLRPPVTISIAFVKGMIEGIQSKGISPLPFLLGAEIPLQLLDEANARVTGEQYVKLFRLIADGIDDDFLGFLSRPLRRGSLAILVRSSLHAPNLGVAMRRIARTFRLLQDDIVLEWVEDNSLAGMSINFAAQHPAWPNFLHEVLLRVIWRVLAWLVGGQLTVTRFDFVFGSPAYADGYSKIFPAQIVFNAQRSAFWFDASRLQAPIRRDEAALRAFLAHATEAIVMPQRSHHAMSARVRSHLHATRPLWPNLDLTAKALNVAPSTLQRHLSYENTSFQLLKDEVRRDLAIYELNIGRTSITQLADELGFADRSAFQRAFKLWTGSSPGNYRKQ